jgi:GTPase
MTNSEDKEFKSGFVALVGRPNAGKSTLINAIVKDKVAITSNTPQTTRHRFRAIFTDERMQMIMVDTPGLHRPHDALGEELNVSALKALEDVDVIAMLIDASAKVGRGDEWVANQVAQSKAKKILVISKADLSSQEQTVKQIEAAQNLAKWDDVVVLSSVEDFNIDGFKEAVYKYLPQGPKWFPQDMHVDQAEEVLIAEFIREKILTSMRDEIPHAIGVYVDSIERNDYRTFAKIFATIYVERNSQKGIIIGHKGQAIKQIGTEARVDLERLLSCKVHLDLNVKVRKNWRKDATQVKRFGYGEGL